MTRRFARVPIAGAALNGEHALRVLIALGAFAGKAGQCWPSLATLGQVAGLDRRKVPAALRKLIAAGLVTKIGSAAGRSATYQLHYELTPAQVSALTPLEASPDTATDTPTGDRLAPLEVTDAAPTDTPRGALTAQEIEQPNEQPTLLEIENENQISEIDLAAEAWRAMATETGLPTVRKLTKPLRSSIKARLRDCGSIHAWQETVARVGQSEFLCGGGDRGWRADLHWLVNPRNFEKVAAGNFDNRPGRSGGKGKITDLLAANIRRADGDE